MKKELLEKANKAKSMGADMQQTEKTKKPTNTNDGKPEMKMKNLRIIASWDRDIKNFTGQPVSGYIINALKKQMIEDGLL